MVTDSSRDKIKKWTHRISLLGMVIGIILTFTTPFYYWLGREYADFGVPGMTTFFISFIIYICIQFKNEEFDWIGKVALFGMVLGVVFVFWATSNVEMPIFAHLVSLALIGTSIIFLLFIKFKRWHSQDSEQK